MRSSRDIPERLFNPSWYSWQNPDWSKAHKAPFEHYDALGRRQWRDPSPFVDMTRYRRMTRIDDADRAFQAILSGLEAPALGVYGDSSDLSDAQTRFREGIEVVAALPDPPRRKRRNLVFYQCGTGGRIADLMTDAGRDWDLLVNYYDVGGFVNGAGDYVFFQAGTKFTAMWNIWRDYRGILSDYDCILFLDDDIVVAPGALDRAFDAAAENGLDLAQMSLKPGSHCVWPIFFRPPEATGVREVSAVEIMMPMISGRALHRIAPTFGDAVSGFGLDLLWGKIVAEAGGRAGVIDEVEVSHPKPIDQSGGGFYDYLRRHAINAKTELWDLMTRHDLPRDIRVV